MKKTSKKPRVFYGYWIVVAAFFCLFVWSGCGFYGFSLFVKPLEIDLGWSRGEIMVAFTIFYLGIGLASPFIGKLVDHYGARKAITTGAILTGLGFVLLSFIKNLWPFYLGWATVGIGIAATGTVPASAIVSNWFKKRRGIAIGIMSTGMGVGGFVMAPVTGGYLIPNFGWRASYLILAIIAWVLIIPLALLVIRTKPADIGLYPDGAESPEVVTVTETKSSTAEGLTLKMALATPALWLIGISFLTGAIGRNGVFHNQVPLLQDIGFPVTTATAAFGAVALTSVIGRLGFGWLCDRMPIKYVWCISLGFHVVSILAIMSVSSESSLTLIWIYAIAMGLAAGGWLPVGSMIVSTTFGLASYGAIFGVLMLLMAIGVSTGPLIAGHIYDIMSSYHSAFIILLALCVVAIPPILAMRRPKPPSNQKG